MDNQNLPNVPAPGPAPEQSAPAAPGAAYPAQPAVTPQGQAPYYAAQPTPGTGAVPPPVGNVPPASGGVVSPPPGYAPAARGAYPGYPPPAAPPPRKKKKGLIIGISIGLAAVLLLGVAGTLAVRMLLPATTLMSAVSKTFSALQKERENNLSALGITQAFEMLETSPAEQEIYVELPAGGLLPERMGARVAVQSDLPNHKVLADITVEQSGLSLLTSAIAADDDLLSLSVPALYRGSYGLHTETLGKDLNNSALGDMLGLDIPGDLSFNLFDALEPSTAMLTEESTAKISETVKTASGDIAVKSGAREPVEVNGESQNCRLYTAILPKSSAQKALRGMINAVLNDANYRERMEESTELISMAGGYTSVDEMFDEITDMYDDLADSLESDVTASIWVAGGYMRRADLSWEMNMDSEDLAFAVSIEFGTKDKIGGALTATVAVNDQSLRVVRTNTVLEKAGPYSSATQLYMNDGYEDENLVDLKLDYDPAAGDNNFRLRLTSGADGDFTMDVRGTVSIDPAKKSIDAVFDKIEIDTYYSTVSLKGSYRLNPLGDSDIAMPDPTLLTEMSEKDLHALIEIVNAGASSLTW